MFKIVIPQAIKNILPTLGNEFISLIKETSVVSFIAVADLYKAFNDIGSNNYEVIIPYCAMALIYVVLIVVFAIVGKLAFRPFVLVGTSLVGAYALVRGVSIFIGGFPNESTIIDLISKGEMEQLNELLQPLFYVYMAVWFVASIAASVAQFKINSEDIEEINEETESGKKKATKKFFLGTGGFGLDKM
jgi:hypothetical protein